MPERLPTAALRGLGILVTRPAHQAEGLCRLMAQAGGRPLRFAALEILPCADPALRRLLRQRWDLAIYISANAVRCALALGLPDAASNAVVGQATAQALETAGVTPEWLPERADSEGLLALPALAQVRGWRILIVRGQGGRALLGESLRQRGALVEYAEVYRRALPATDPAELLARWQHEVQIVTATSSDLLDNLLVLLGEAGAAKLRATPLLVVSERMQQHARALGIGASWRAAGADDWNMYQALCRMAEEA